MSSVSVPRPAPVRFLLVLLISLTVALVGHGTSTAAAAQCGSAASTGIVFIIDDSGSMAGTDPSDLRWSAVSAALGTLPAGVTVSAARFDSMSEAVFAPTQLSNSNRDQLKQLAKAGGGGGTDYPAAWAAAKSLLDSMPPGVSNRAVIFLTDGEPNDGPGDPIALGVPVYTIGFGLLDTGRELLAKIATDTGGESFIQTTSENDVIATMTVATQRVVCDKGVVDITIPVAAGKTVKTPFRVPAGTREWTALVSWNTGAQATIRFTRPTKPRVMAAGRLKRGERLSTGVGFASAGVTRPQAGRWFLVTTAPADASITSRIQIFRRGLQVRSPKP